MDKSHEKSCQATKEDGTQCRATAGCGSRFCFFHDPGKADEREAARRAGGIERTRRRPVLPSDTPDLPLRSATDIVELLAQTMNQVRRGQLDPKNGNCIGLLASVALKAMEMCESERIATLERIIRFRPSDPTSRPKNGKRFSFENPKRGGNENEN
jgi:hypothetical protein